MIIYFQHFYLLLNLAAKLAYHIFCFGDHNIKAVNAVDFRRGCIQAVDVDLAPCKYDRDPVQQTNLVLGVNRDVKFLFYILVAHFVTFLIALSPHPALSKGEGSKTGKPLKALSFGEGWVRPRVV